jgi:hypothetical protein
LLRRRNSRLQTQSGASRPASQLFPQHPRHHLVVSRPTCCLNSYQMTPILLYEEVFCNRPSWRGVNRELALFVSGIIRRHGLNKTRFANESGIRQKKSWSTQSSLRIDPGPGVAGSGTQCCQRFHSVLFKVRTRGAIPRNLTLDLEVLRRDNWPIHWKLAPGKCHGLDSDLRIDFIRGREKPCPGIVLEQTWDSSCIGWPVGRVLVPGVPEAIESA